MLDKDVGVVPADATVLATLDDPDPSIRNFQVPTILDGRPARRLMVVGFDGSGQDADRPSSELTNIGHLRDSVQLLVNSGRTDVASGYVGGVGTHHDPIVALLDNIRPFTHGDRVQSAYLQIAAQARVWRNERPDADIHLFLAGYSRGAALVPGLARMIERHGIADADGLLRFGRDGAEITVVSDRPPLVPPGDTAQVVFLIDPVGTGLPRDYDFRLPSSVISGVASLALDERRRFYPHLAMIGEGITDEGRFVRHSHAGAHADGGGGTAHPGISTAQYNIMASVLNATSVEPIVAMRSMPEDPGDYAIHRSERAAFGLMSIGASGHGEPRLLRETLCIIEDPCKNALPIDQALAARFSYRTSDFTLFHEAFPDWWPSVVRDRGPEADDGATRAAAIPAVSTASGHPLVAQARAGLAAIAAGHPRGAEVVASEAMAASLALAAQRGGLARIDHVIAGTRGDLVFAVEGRPEDPAHRRVVLDVEGGSRRPVAEALAELASAPAVHDPAPRAVRDPELRGAIATVAPDEPDASTAAPPVPVPVLAIGPR